MQTTALLQLLIFDIRFASKEKVVIIVRGIGNGGIEFLIFQLLNFQLAFPDVGENKKRQTVAA